MDYKGYNVESLGTFPMFSIKAKGQGKVPASMDGVFTNTFMAFRAIDAHLEGLKKGYKNGKTKDGSSD